MTASPNWSPLDTELRRWSQDGRVLPLWWRDDDAIAPTTALDRLSALADHCDMPVHLAIIPAQVTETLATELPDNCIPLVHGWAHVSHAVAGQKKSEFPTSRDLSKRHSDAAAGLSRMRNLFGPRLVPMFVPPWNRIGADLIPELTGLGYTFLSTFTPRPDRDAAPGLTQINTHLDPINWRGDRSVVDPDTLIAQVTRNLEARRALRSDTSEPFGILTHHLVHDNAIWSFTEALINRLLEGPATPWQSSAPNRSTEVGTTSQIKGKT